MNFMIRVATVDNHEVVREGVAARIERAATDVAVIASVSTVEELGEAGAEAEVVLLDLWLDDGDSLSAIAPLVGAGCHVLLYTTEQRPVRLRKAIECGASGLLLKRDPLDTVVDGIRAAAAGEFYCSGALAHALLTDEKAVADLSTRQVEILEALADGMDYRAVAAFTGSSEAAVKTHLGRIRDKFRGIGIEPGNAHHLTRIAKDQGHID